MSEVRFFKLVSGDEIVARATRTGREWTLRDPHSYTVKNDRLWVAPWLFYGVSSSQPIPIIDDHIVVSTPASPSARADYEKALKNAGTKSEDILYG